MKALKEFLRPEFINRVDEIITFNHLTKEDFAGIANIMLEELKQSLGERGLSLTWEGEINTYLVDRAFSVTYGARNLRRIIQRELEDPISERIIDSFEAPISAIHIHLNKGAVALKTE
jgi:ATP-dependent Clp protease ATP-binding subunit ClpA